jgi:alanyl-tRNA synthetase
VLPSNEGRGYVVRRILRRAVVKALELGIQEAFIYKVAGRVIDSMREAYPELAEQQEKIALIIRADEERFEKTLSRGMAILEDALEELKSGKAETGTENVIPGDVVFKLYDTYGFPVEITRELAENQGFNIDLDGFENEMEAQRERARQSSKMGGDQEVVDEMGRAPATFIGYELLEVPTVISSMSRGGEKVEWASAGDEVEIELERTPFYPEGGGQVSDVGTLAGNNGKARVNSVAWLGGDTIVHSVTVESGTLNAGDGVVAKVDVPRRKDTQRNHTATHLLHSALRSVLGSHVRQSGSLVAPDRLRFDFTHYEPLSDAEVTKIEDLVNARVLENMPVQSSVEAYETARDRGVIALFGEKYGQEVRVVNIEATSCELCGGTHVEATGEIGAFRIISESGIASGVRRIEAMTGRQVVDAARDLDRELERIAAALRVPVHDVEEGARKTVERLKALEREVSDLRGRLAGSEVGDILESAVDVGGIKVVASRVDAPDLEMLKRLADQIKEKLGDGVVCVGSASGGRVFIVVSVSPGVVDEKGVKASAIAKKMGEMVGGRGGGKDTFAQAGGKDETNLDNALGQCAEVVGSLAR